MTHLLIVGLNHQTAPIELRERVTFDLERSREATKQLHDEGLLQEAVIVSTCNRSEIYGVSEEDVEAVSSVQSFVCQFHQVEPQRINGSFYHHLDAAAVRHLFRVVSSLDSMILGEPHILGQVRDAFLVSLQNRTTGMLLNHLFQKAAQVGKRIRAETEIGLRPVSVSSVAVELATRIFGDLHTCSALVVGAGDISQLTVRTLALRGVHRISVANRSFDRANDLARQFAGRAIPWESFSEEISSHDIVVSSVQADSYIARRDVIEEIMDRRKGQPLFLIDLGVPRNIDPAAQSVYNVFLYNIDDLQSIAAENQRERENDIPKAERIIDEEVEKFMKWHESLPVIPTIKTLRQEAERIREAELQAHLRKLGDVSDRERNIITALSHAIVNKILHTPTVRLKESTDEQYLESIRYLFDLEEKK